MELAAASDNEAPSLNVAGRIFGDSEKMAEVLRLVGKVAHKTVDVLLLGESGTGKELLARTLHASGKNADGPFVAVNLAAIPHELLAAELFGVERGAYTGAGESRPGKLELAAEGTLFLDEVGEMPIALQ